MAVPDLKGELTIGGAQVDITGDLYARDGITHTRGRAYRKSAADPASCAMTIRNVDGRYTQRNPMGPYYGQLGRNTPFRLTLPGVAPYLATTTSSATDIGASTPDTAVLDITGDIDIRFEATLTNWMASGSVELAGKGSQGTNQRSWLLMMRDQRIRLEWSTAGTSTLGATSTVSPSVWAGKRMAVRVTLDVDNGASGNTVTFYTADSLAGPWTQLGAPVVQSGTTSVFNSTAPVLVGNGWADLGFPAGSGQVHAFELRSGINGSVVADPDFSLQAPGAASFVDGAGRTWTVGAGSRITDRVVRCALEVPEWPPKWATSEADAWTPIEAAGILRRMGQGQKALQSTLRRRIPSGSPLAYWPLEDGRNAVQFSSPIPRVRPMTVSGMDLAATDTLAGSSALPIVRGGSFFSGSVPAPLGATTSWHAEFVFFAESGPATARTLVNWFSTGTVRRWRLMLDSDGAQIHGYDADDTEIVTQLVVLTGSGVFNAWTRWQVFASQNGSNVNYTIGWIPIGGAGGVVDGSYAGSVGRITGVSSNADGAHADLDGVGIGHVSVFTTAGTQIYNSADLGFAGETAGARMRRLALEEGVPLTIVGDSAATELVGAQRPMALLDLLREAADADGGILGEASNRRELVYRTRANLYNQTPKLTLDYGSGQVAPPFEPVEDDQVRNDWEVQRDGGSSGRAVLEDGPLSVQDPPNGIGLYDDSVTLNLADDEQTEPVANWLLHLTSWDEARYPQVTVRLHRSPELVPDVLGLEVGDKIRLTNLPVRFASGSEVELLVDGWTERFGPRAWEITFNCAPAGPWTVGVTDDAILGKADTDGSQLAAAATSTATSLSVATTAGPLWITSDRLTGNPDFELDTSGWTIAGGTLTRVLTPGPAPFDGSWSGLITPDGTTATVSAESSDGAVTAGGSYRVFGWLRCAAARTVDLCVNWYDSGAVFLSTTVNSIAVAANVWTRFDFTQTAPASAAIGRARPRMTGTPPSSALLWLDVCFLATPGSLAGEFPFEARVGGEVVLVRAITGTSSPQTFTVKRSVNGVVKAQSSGTSLRLAQPSIVAL